jgi:hypothetical protein
LIYIKPLKRERRTLYEPPSIGLLRFDAIKADTMAETTKLSVEKALEKLRGSDEIEERAVKGEH